ncbi:MAG TPA: AMP-binding protein [Caulobacteraceae bacterium]
MSQTLSSALTWWSNLTPDSVAINMEGDALTYRAYHDWADRIAVKLLGLGVQRGDRVAVFAANSLPYCALIMGIMRAGAMVLPINLRLTPHEIAEILEDTTPALLVADNERQAKLGDIGIRVVNTAEIAALREGERQSPSLDIDVDAPVVIITTSGSTAKPKGVIFTHRSMTSYAAEFALAEPAITKGAKVLILSPFATSAGFVQLMHYTTLGCTLYVEPVFDPDRALFLLETERINAFGGVPVFFERVAACARWAQADLSDLRLVTVGGARVSRALLDTWMKKGPIIRQIYGQTEIGGNGTIMPAALAADQPEKCGRGGVFTDLRIVGDDGRAVPPNTPGEILMRGPGMMKGYWNNPQATAEAIRDGWLHTGDIGMLDEDGLLTFIDRKKDIIISGGMNISAAEVERAISEFEGVEEVVVISADDRKFGETPMAVLYANRLISVENLVAHCNSRLADYKVPRYVVVEDEPLPRLATGKLSKPAVRLKWKDAAASLPRVR